MITARNAHGRPLDDLADWRPLDAALADAGVSERLLRRLIGCGATISIEQRPGHGFVVDGDVLAAVAQVVPPSVEQHRAVKAARAALERAARQRQDASDLLSVVRAKLKTAQDSAIGGDDKAVDRAQRAVLDVATAVSAAEIYSGRVAEARRGLGRAIEVAVGDVAAATQERATKSANAWARALRSAENAYREHAAAVGDLARLGAHPSAALVAAGDFAIVLERNKDGHVARLAAQAGVA
jgi:hypothetical protein